MNKTPKILSTSDVRRDAVIASAITVFARTGYLGTSVATIAQDAKISQAYVFKLFPSKELLFVTALDRCFELVLNAMRAAADKSADHTPAAMLETMGQAYAELIADRALLMLQVHAQSAASVPEIGAALRNGLRNVTLFVKSRSGAPDLAVQQFIAYGMLCHLVVVADLDKDSADWARIIAAGINHPDKPAHRP